MNINRLKQAEKIFFDKYPDGFSNSELLDISKHVEKMKNQSQEFFKKEKFENIENITEGMIKIVSRSSLVSMFEKPKFRDYIRNLKDDEKEKLSNSLYNFLYGNQQLGFDSMLDVLKKGKLAKWSLMTVIPYHFNPTNEVFVKPTTTKNVIKHFEIIDIEYRPQPTFKFYKKYRELIQKMKLKADSSLSPDSAAFTGFLMIAIQGK